MLNAKEESSNDNNTDILLNPDGSCARQVMKELLNPKKIVVICILRVCNWRKIAQADKVTKFAIALIIFKVKINFALRLKNIFRCHGYL